MKRALRLSGLVCLALVMSLPSSPLRASEDMLFEEFLFDIPARPRSSLWFELRSGLQDSSDFNLYLDYALPSADRLLVGGGKASLGSALGSYNTYSFNLGYHNEYGRDFEFGVLYDFWGNTRDLWTHALSVPLRINTVDWAIDIIPMFTRINLYRTSFFSDRQRRLVTTASQSLELRAGYYGFLNWEILFGGARYHYNDNIEGLDNPLARLFFSDIALVLSYGFPDRRAFAELAYNFSMLRLGLNQERTESAVDHSILDITALMTAIYINDAFAVHLEAGRVLIDRGDKTDYAKLALQWNF